MIASERAENATLSGVSCSTHFFSWMRERLRQSPLQVNHHSTRSDRRDFSATATLRSDSRRHADLENDDICFDAGPPNARVAIRNFQRGRQAQASYDPSRNGLTPREFLLSKYRLGPCEHISRNCERSHVPQLHREANRGPGCYSRDRRLRVDSAHD